MFWKWLFTLYVTVWVLQGTETFTVVTYNVENYFLADFGTRKAKSEASRMKVVEFLEAIDADVIALQEIGRRALRRLVVKRLNANPDENLFVVGDLNDTPNTDPIKDLVGRRAPRFVDLRSVEHNGDQAPHPTNQSYGPRRVAWTHFYWAKDDYSRLDYQLASKGMARELDRSGTRAQTMADWVTASDHRPVVARFFVNDR
jgi:endonuclease/exonuclease/phosphatase family metal-dependent hydrolase